MTEVEKSIFEASEAFQSAVWPHLKSDLGGGDIVPVETVMDIGFAKSLDILAGIDAWHFVTTEKGKYMRGIACRVQWRPKRNFDNYPYDSFTLRYDIGGGQTEFQKRMSAIKERDRGFLYPHLTVQAYLEDRAENKLIQYGVVRTEDLINVCDIIKIENRRPLVNPADGKKFHAVWWSEVSRHVRLKIKKFDTASPF